MKPCPARPALAVCRPECAPVFGRLADTLRMRNRRVRLFPLVAALLLGLLVVSCTPEYIPNTDVEDTAENRGVISFCEEYRRAVEQRKIGLLLQLAAPSYYEDGGNVDATDDIDYAGLKDYLEDKCLWARWTALPAAERQAAENGELEPGYKEFAAFMAWGPPADTQRRGDLSYHTFIRCTSGPKAGQYVSSNLDCDGTSSEIEISVKDGVVTEIKRLN